MNPRRNDKANHTTILVVGVVILVVMCSCASLLPQSPKNQPNREHPSDANTVSERWECYDFVYRSRKLGTLTADRYGASGTVDFNGIVASTKFSIEGIERRWDWGWGTDGRSDYAIVISADGTGKFYNFRGSSDGMAKPSDFFKCDRR